MLQEIKRTETQGWLIPLKDRLTVPSHFQFEKAGAVRAEKHPKKENSRREVTSETGYEGACFVLCALESTCSLIKREKKSPSS